MAEATKAVAEGWEEVDPDRVFDYALRMNNSAVFKRLGYLLEHHRLADGPYLARLRQHLRPGYSKLDPLNPLRGPHCHRWQLRINMRLHNATPLRAHG
jgi:predicted transcriptional regulator of viral defense system